MTILACFGNFMDTDTLIYIFAVILGIAAITVGGIAILISKICEVGKRKVLGAEAIMLFACGLICISMEWYVSVLLFSGAIASGFLLALGWLTCLIRGWHEARQS